MYYLQQRPDFQQKFGTKKDDSGAKAKADEAAKERPWRDKQQQA